jgi:polysaccharide export outer membrane protein
MALIESIRSFFLAWRRILRIAAGLISFAWLVLFHTGCANEYNNLRVFHAAHEEQVTGTEYRLEPPDVVTIHSPTAGELDNDTQPLRSDGKITLRLLGDVEAAGLTPTELAHKLEQQLSKYYVSPTVSVRVAAFESKKIYVFGHVGRTGAMPFTGRDTLLDVISRAQAIRGSWTSNVKVIRPSPVDDDRHAITVDLDRIMQAGNTKSNFLLQEGDIVYVPPTPAVWLGMQIQELLFPVRGAAELYSAPAQFIGATDYYQNRDTGRTYIQLGSTGDIPGVTGF